MPTVRAVGLPSGSPLRNETAFKQRINTVLLIGVDANSILSKLQREGVYWIPGDVKMSDRGRKVRLEFMTRDEAIDELVIREQEFRHLQDKMPSLRLTGPPVDVIVPVVVAIVECQLRIHQLQEFLISPARNQWWFL